MKQNNPKLYRKTGQGLVEFALIFPLLLLLIFGVIEIGRAFYVYIVVTSTSREAPAMAAPSEPARTACLFTAIAPASVRQPIASLS